MNQADNLANHTTYPTLYPVIKFIHLNPTGMVRFDSNPEQFNSGPVLARLEASIAKCMDLDARIAALDEEVALNPQFVKKVNSTSGQGQGQGQGHSGGHFVEVDEGNGGPGPSVQSGNGVAGYF